MARIAVLCLTLFFLASSPTAQTPKPSPDFDLTRLETMVPLVEKEIAEKKLPGAVVLVGRGDRVVWQKAIGNRALVPYKRR
jgi:hypothetical protein